ncbi:MAG: hypothetical protein WC919_00185 [Candidatus Paceibacterota bacterium]|jgi:hypothetical protein
MTATKTRRTSKDAPEEKPVKLPTKLTEEQVLAKLGRPVDLRSIDVHRYDTSRCRVNVRRAMTKATAEEYFKQRKVKDYAKMLEEVEHSMDKVLVLITDSFYLRTNYDGSIRSDNEEQIERRY